MSADSLKLQQGFAVPNTLGLSSVAEWGCRFHSSAELQQLIQLCAKQRRKLTIVGQGSNVIAPPRISGCVGVPAVAGIELLSQSAGLVRVRAGAGENWHRFVLHCLGNGWHGLENLALIPGTVGAAPVQNIGAYGVELADRIESVEVVDERGRVRAVAAEDCGFGYRSSMFQANPELVICAVTLRLHQSSAVTTHYPDVDNWFRRRGIKEPGPRQVAEAVVAIRSAKLPDPARVPNAGSFFKNPLIEPVQAQLLQEQYPGLKTFAQDNSHRVKLSAAQLIDLAGCKQFNAGPVRCWSRQPLVLVNAGRGSYSQVMAFAARVQKRVSEQFSVQLEIEPTPLYSGG